MFTRHKVRKVKVNQAACKARGVKTLYHVVAFRMARRHVAYEASVARITY